MQTFTETAGEMTSITTLHAKAPDMLFDVKMMSENNFLEGSAKILINMYTEKTMKLASMILASFCMAPWVSSAIWWQSFGPIYDHLDHDSVLLSERWGCREHFVSGCWHSSGRDRGRLPQGVLVIYFGSAASWRPCNVVRPHQGPVSHS